MFNHDGKSILECLNIEMTDVVSLIDDFSQSVVDNNKLSRAIEDMIIKLNSLEGEDERKYWNSILFCAHVGMNAIMESFNKEIEEKIND